MVAELKDAPFVSADALELGQVGGSQQQLTDDSRIGPASMTPLGKADTTSASSLSLVRQRLTLSWTGITLTATVSVPVADAQGNRSVLSRLPFTKGHATSMERTILNNMTSIARPGELLAIMGPSGGGKTSLLNVISGRIAPTAGSVLVNSRPLPKEFNRLASYVMQDDILFETLTPRELFTFSAALRLPELTKEQQKDRVEEIIKRLSLQACADTRVGQPLVRGLSGGERKRTAIGYEMITNPSLLFLDEPTSGLDSYTALSLVELLKELAREGRTIICTIHQPSSEIFEQFDKLLFLAKGRIAYNGPASQVGEYFAGLGFPCPTYTNPADFYMKVLHTQTEADYERIKKIADAYESGQSKTLDLAVDQQDDVKLRKVARPGLLKEIALLTQRSFRTYLRNPLAFHARLLQNIFVALLVGILYYKVVDTQTGIQDRTGSLFFITVSTTMSAVMSVLLTFPTERVLLVKEQQSGMYTIFSYYVGKFFSDAPFSLLFPLVFACISYWMVGYQATAGHFFIYLLALYLIMNVASGMGLFLGCAFPNAEVAVSLAPIAIIPFMLFGGFFVNLDSIPVWLSWIQYISIFKWGFQAILINEFRDLTLTCSESELLIVGGQRICPITDGTRVITNFSVDPNDLWLSIIILAVLFIGLRILAYGLLELQTRRAMRK